MTEQKRDRAFRAALAHPEGIDIKLKNGLALTKDSYELNSYFWTPVAVTTNSGTIRWCIEVLCKADVTREEFLKIRGRDIAWSSQRKKLTGECDVNYDFKEAPEISIIIDNAAPVTLKIVKIVDFSCKEHGNEFFEDYVIEMRGNSSLFVIGDFKTTLSDMIKQHLFATEWLEMWRNTTITNKLHSTQ